MNLLKMPTKTPTTDVRKGEVPTPRPLSRPGTNRLARLNKTGPRNTIDRRTPPTSVRSTTRASFSSNDGGFLGNAQKRPNRDRESTYKDYGNRPTKRLRPNPSVSRDLTQDDDAESIDRSISSNEGASSHKGENKVQIRQEELRNTASQGCTARRRRTKARKRELEKAAETRSIEGSQRGPVFLKSASPDELRNSSPPPVVSDILPPKPTPSSKLSRSAQSCTGPGSLSLEANNHRRQRAPPEEISEDELAHDGRKQAHRGKKLQASSGRTPHRSDINMRMRRAVSGSFTFEPESEVDLVGSNTDNTTTWTLATKEGKPSGFPWLQLDASRINKVQSAPDSEIVMVHRPQSNGPKQIPPKLVLEFNSEQESHQFVLELQTANPTIKFEQKPSRFLRQVLERDLADQQRYGDAYLADDATQAGASGAGSREQLEFRDSDAAPRGLEDEARGDGATVDRQNKSKPRLIDGLSSDTGQKPFSRRSSSPPSKAFGTPRTRRATRQSTRGDLFWDEDPFLPRWSIKNTEWEKNWDRELVYPSTGRDRATVHKEDIHRLDEGGFLNDNLIFCYLRYLQVEMERERPEIAKRIYFMNTYFFEILRNSKGASINYEGVKRWTSKVDIFSYDYIVVPVNEEAHWYLAIVCNPGVIIEEGQETDDDVVFLENHKEKSGGAFSPPRTRRNNEAGSQDAAPSSTKSPRTPKSAKPAAARKPDSKDIRIITLDSLGSSHSKTCQMLRRYLVEEAKFRKNFNSREFEKKIGLTAKNIPSQANFCDCGVFLLGYAQRFLEDPDGFVGTILQRGRPEWTVDPSELRNQIRETIFRLHGQYREEMAQRKQERKQMRKKEREEKQGSSATGTPDVTASEEPSEKGPALREPDVSNDSKIAGDEDMPLATPAREETSGDCSAEPGPVHLPAEKDASPCSAPQPATPTKGRKVKSSPRKSPQDQNSSGAASASVGGKQSEGAVGIKKSIEQDGDEPGSSPHNATLSSDSSSVRDQPDQADEIFHSPSARSPPDAGKLEIPESPVVPPKHSIEIPDDPQPSEPRFMSTIPSSSPQPPSSAARPVFAEDSPRKRRTKVVDVEGDDESPRAPKRARETGTTSSYFTLDDGVEDRFVSRKDIPRRLRGKKKTSRDESAWLRGQGRRSSDAIDLTE